MAGPIIFSTETARGQLLSEGEVVTFRTDQRTTGETWWRESRHGPKQGDVTVEEIDAANPRDEEALAEYCELSGFESVEDWQEAIWDLNRSVPERGYLYRVTLKG